MVAHAWNSSPWGEEVDRSSKPHRLVSFNCQQTETKNQQRRGLRDCLDQLGPGPACARRPWGLRGNPPWMGAAPPGGLSPGREKHRECELSTRHRSKPAFVLCWLWCVLTSLKWWTVTWARKPSKSSPCLHCFLPSIVSHQQKRNWVSHLPLQRETEASMTFMRHYVCWLVLCQRDTG